MSKPTTNSVPPSEPKTANDPSAEYQDLHAKLAARIGAIAPGAQTIENLRRLSGGASQETWSFDAHQGDGTTLPLILRRAPGGSEGPDMGTGVGLAREAAVIRACAAQGVPVPAVPYVMNPEDGVGPAYVMARIDGETIARRILRNPEFETARKVMARQCGEILARIHAVDRDHLPDLDTHHARDQWQRYRDIYDGFDEPRPVFDYAFRWLDAQMPERSEATTLVHGDFRNGNLMVGPEGVRAVLDWELTHFGDPAEDLGWICVNSWRFGISEKVVGGFGDLSDLLAGYAGVSGQHMDPDRVHFWIVFGTLKWGIMCMMMMEAFRSGRDRSVERAAIGRRASETEIDLVNLIISPN